MKHLAEAAKHWPLLTDLNLCNQFIDISAKNKIGVDGMKHLAEAAKYWPNLTDLFLSN